MEKLDEFRAKIEEIDEQLAKLICERMKTSVEIGNYKKANGLSIFDPQREEKLKEKNLQMVEEKYRSGYSEIFEVILKVSKDLQL